MNDTEVIEKVLGVVQSDLDWTAESLAGALRASGWQSRAQEPVPTWWALGEVVTGLFDIEDQVLLELIFEQWDPDDHPDLDNVELELLGKPRIDALRDLFVARADDRWQPGEIPPEDDGAPCGYHHGWHSDVLSVEIGAVQQDNGLPAQVVLRAYNYPKS